MGLDRTNPMGRVMLSILAFEAIVFGLAIAGMIQVDAVSVPVAFGIAGVVVVLLIGWVMLSRKKAAMAHHARAH